jgi:hypothetical protein
MKAHWTQRTIRDYLFRIAADFIAQLEKKMEAENISLAIVAKYAKALSMKMSIIAYEDDDPENIKGPINSEIFKICWEACGKPHDFWELQETEESKQDAAQVALAKDMEVSEPVSAANATPQIYYFRGGVMAASEMSPSGSGAAYGKELGAAYMLGGTHETKHAN